MIIFFTDKFYFVQRRVDEFIDKSEITAGQTHLYPSEELSKFTSNPRFTPQLNGIASGSGTKWK